MDQSGERGRPAGFDRHSGNVHGSGSGAGGAGDEREDYDGDSSAGAGIDADLGEAGSEKSKTGKPGVGGER